MRERKLQLRIEPIGTAEAVEIPMFRGNQLFKAPQAAITAPTGGATTDAEARTAINSIITTLENLGLVKLN